MSEDFKDKISKQENEKQEQPSIAAKEVAEPTSEDWASQVAMLKQLFPAALDFEGTDWSLMTSPEKEIEDNYFAVRKYLVERYPQPVQEALAMCQPTDADGEEPYDINIHKAAADPQSIVFLKGLHQVKTIHDKVHTLQANATEYEKYCIRFYRYISLEWNRHTDLGSCQRTPVGQ